MSRKLLEFILRMILIVYALFEHFKQKLMEEKFDIQPSYDRPQGPGHTFECILAPWLMRLLTLFPVTPQTGQ